jgi:7-cyano-7-deazaguanine reductase
MSTLLNSPLGKTASYADHYQADLLFPLARKTKRDEINVPEVLPFFGADIWNAFEISWLNASGKPQVAVGEFIFPSHSPNIIESKSFKLYLNSFNNTVCQSLKVVTALMTHDLSQAAGSPVDVKLQLVNEVANQTITAFTGVNLDLLDVACDTYTVAPELLKVEKGVKVSEIVFSDLLKSNCLVTGQPDWGSVRIHYQGDKINQASLLKYIVSFRNHDEFHEQCIERIFMDIMQRCMPAQLTVEARYTRRGGLDINPYRSTDRQFIASNERLCRQ